MRADNEIIIRRKQNGLYKVTHASASSLIHALANVEPTEEDLELSVIADDIDGLDKAREKAEDFEAENYIEYGIREIL